MNDRKLYYLWGLRFAAGGLAIFTWWVSVKFSAEGFSIEHPEYVWIGIGLALVCTVLQLIFNKGSFTNPTLFFGGLIAYAYGVAMNYRGMKNIGLFGASDKLGTGLTAVLIEILPEALFLWGFLNEEGQGLGDFLSSLLTWTDLRLPGRRGARQQSGSYSGVWTNGRTSGNVHGQTPQSPVHSDTWTDGQTSSSVRGQTSPPQTTGEKRARAYIREHLKMHGILPSARQVPGVGKSKAAELLRGYRAG